MTRTPFSSTDLHQLQRQLCAWRHRQSGRPRLPEALWTAAATLAQSLGVSAVARTLHLDYVKLRQRLAGRASPASSPPTFVEVTVAEAPGPRADATAVELADGTGARMTLRLRGDLPTLLALAASFWRRAR